MTPISAMQVIFLQKNHNNRQKGPTLLETHFDWLHICGICKRIVFGHVL